MLPGHEIIRSLSARALSLPGRALPYAMQVPFLDFALNSAFRTPLGNGELDFLDGSRVRIRVVDLGLDWLIEVDVDRFRVIDRLVPEDVSISGDSRDFLLLATRRADPDTLFFKRRIRIEGDTELGLGVKNTMDSMDWDDLPPPLRRLLQGASAAIGRLQAWQAAGRRNIRA
ncbi:MAG: SCP2 sterol-binding domain-containing protein [Lysobacterales bacterium]